MDALGAEVWLDAAWEVFREQGISSVKIEPIAKRLGATKGSFYWHFTNRQELIDKLMERWQNAETEHMIDIANEGGSPESRLTALFDAVATMRSTRSGEVTLYTEAEREGVQDAVHKVTERRIHYLADTLVDLGFERLEALRRGTIAVTLVIGLEQLIIGTGRVPEAAGPSLTRTALQMMLAPEKAPTR